jgi:hypothetical protein
VEEPASPFFFHYAHFSPKHIDSVIYGIVFSELRHCSLEHVLEKLIDFSDKNMLHFFDFERVLIDRMIPSDRNAL